MKSSLETALEAVAAGWRVFPVHSIGSDGLCTCGQGEACDSPGKHPRTPQGLLDATYLEDRVREWWGRWPDANLAVATGPESGIWVLDVDADKGGLISLEQLQAQVGELHAALSVRTGGGGRHLYFLARRDDEEFVSSRVGVLPGIDVRGYGGYVLLPPSRHASGNAYEWEQSDVDLRRTWITDAPFPLLAQLRQAERRAERNAAQHVEGEVIPQGARDDRLTSIAGAMRRQGLSEDEMLAALLVVNQRCDPPMGERQVAKIARSVARYQPQEASAHMASSSLPEEVLPLPLTRNEPFPEELLELDGLLGELVAWITAEAPRRQPVAALGAALAALGALYGRRVRTLTNLRSNLYVVLLAESGRGKDAPRSMIADAFEAAGLESYLGTSDWKSGQGMLRSLAQAPTGALLFPIDEFGDVMRGMADPRAPSYLKKIAQNLKVLYSSAGTTLRVPAGDIEREAAALLWPHAAVLGTSTPGAFYGALTASRMEDGLGNRFLILPLDARPDINPASRREPPTAIVDALRQHDEVLRGSGNLAEIVPGLAPCIEVPEEAGVQDRLRVVEAEILYRDEWHAGAIPSLWARLGENATKLALVRAVSRAPARPELGLADLEWGLRLSAWSVRNLESHLYDHSAENDFEARLKRVRRYLSQRSGRWIAHSQLSRASRRGVYPSTTNGLCILRTT